MDQTDSCQRGGLGDPMKESEGIGQRTHIHNPQTDSSMVITREKGGQRVGGGGQGGGGNEEGETLSLG